MPLNDMNQHFLNCMGSGEGKEASETESQQVGKENQRGVRNVQWVGLENDELHYGGA